MKDLTTACKAGRGTPANDKARSTPHAAGLGDNVSKQADSTQSNLVLTTATTEPRIDSRLLAPQLGNKHRHVMALLDKYLDVFKKHGHVSFKNADGERKQGGGKAERYALLNENQAYFLLSLSRNSEIVVALKSKLITAFSDARHASDMRRTEYLPVYHAAHDRIKVLAAGSSSERFDHMNFNKLANKAAGIEAGQRPSSPVPKQALLIVSQMLMTAAMQSAKNGRDAYRLAANAVQPLVSAVQMLVGAA